MQQATKSAKKQFPSPARPSSSTALRQDAPSPANTPGTTDAIPPMRILIISDAWQPQINGVVRTYEHLSEHLTTKGHEVQVLGPRDFPHVPLPFYKEIELAIFPRRKLERMIAAFKPDHIHIAVEGPLGRAAQKICKKRALDYTTCYHSHFPDYVAKRCAWMGRKASGIIRNIVISDMRRFHARSKTVFVATQSLEDTLRSWGFTAPMTRLVRGVNADVFHTSSVPAHATPLETAAQIRNDFESAKQNTPIKTQQKNHPSSADTPALLPTLLYVGRVATEKNIRAFLDLPIKANKVIVGGGPDLETLKSAYPDVHFAGYQTGEALGDYYRAADVFVFPSKTDTFGMVLIEALACGTPIAAYNVTGPKDIIDTPLLGAVSDDLREAVEQVLKTKDHFTRQDRHDHIVAHYSWPAVADVFLNAISAKTVKTKSLRP